MNSGYPLHLGLLGFNDAAAWSFILSALDGPLGRLRHPTGDKLKRRVVTADSVSGSEIAR